jgi:hypothetical protein
MLTVEQKKICDALGVKGADVEAKLAAKTATAANAAGARPPLLHQVGVARVGIRAGLSALATDPAAARRHFAAARFSLGGALECLATPSTLAAVDRVASGMNDMARGELMIGVARRERIAIMRADGRQVIDEALTGGLGGDVNDRTSPAELARRAAEALAEFLANPDADDSWQLLAEAGALLTAALERGAPPYAAREHQEDASRRRGF